MIASLDMVRKLAFERHKYTFSFQKGTIEMFTKKKFENTTAEVRLEELFVR